MIQPRMENPAEKSLEIFGRAIVTMLESSAAMNVAKVVTNSTAHLETDAFDAGEETVSAADVNGASAQPFLKNSQLIGEPEPPRVWCD